MAGVCLPTEMRILLAGVRPVRSRMPALISVRIVIVWASWPSRRKGMVISTTV